jgi:hypothetical protein
MGLSRMGEISEIEFRMYGRGYEEWGYVFWTLNIEV